MASEEIDLLEGNLDDVDWIGKDIGSVYASTSSHPPLNLPGPESTAPRWTANEGGYWFQAFSVVGFNGCWKDVERKVEGEEVNSFMS